MQSILLDPIGREMLGCFIKTSSIFHQNHFEFLSKFMQIASAQGQEQMRLIRKFHLKNGATIHKENETSVNYQYYKKPE
jgi:ferritin